MALANATSPTNVTTTGTFYFPVQRSSTMAFVQLSGTYTGVTFTFQGSYDGSNAFPLAAISNNDQTIVAGTTTVSPTNSTIRSWVLPCAGMSHVGVNVTGHSTGTGVLTVTTSAFVGMPLVGTTNVNNTTSGNQAFSGTVTITSTSASALAVGANGATNPVLSVNANTGSVATGLTIIGNAAASGVALTVLSSGTDDSLIINAKGTGGISLNATATGTVTIGSSLTMTEAKNIILGTSTGSSFGTATTQKLSLYGKTPVVQPVANTTDVSTTAAGSGTTVFLNTTFPGTGGTAAYTVSAVVTALKAVGILAP